MKKGQGQLVAYVLLIGFTVVIGIMVGSWMIKSGGKMGERTTEMYGKESTCMDVSIVAVCDGGPKVMNSGYFTIIKLKVGGRDIRSVNGIKPKGLSQILNTEETIIPFVKVEGKEYGCTNKAITIPEDICVQE